MTQQPFVHPFTEEDRTAVLAMLNQDLPAERTETLAEWRQRDAAMRGDEVYQRWVVATPARAFLEVVDMGTTHLGWRSVAGICEMELVVMPEHRHARIGSTLYKYALQFARARQANTLRCWFYQTGSDCPLMRFLAKRGFVEQGSRQTSQLDLLTFDPSPFIPQAQHVAAGGIKILNSVDVADTVEQQRKLFDLYTAFGSVTPGDSFEVWAAQRFAATDWAQTLLLIAELDGTWIGISEITGIGVGDVCRQVFVGTLEEYRTRGIATALKLAAYEILLSRGCRFVRTSNRLNNVPILAINRKMGFAPTSIEWTFDKPL